MDITDLIPNVFGRNAPTTYTGLEQMGLITPQQIKQQQDTANIQGLLGAGLALAQGMSRTGNRRSAAENILGALAGGLGASGGAYQQGIQNIVQQQQLQSAALQQQQAVNRAESIKAAKLKYPELASLADIDPGKFAEEVALKERLGTIGGTQGAAQGQDNPASLRAQAQRAYMAGPTFKPYADSLTEQADRLEVQQKLSGQPTVQATQPQAQPQVTEQPIVDGQTFPGMVVTDTSGPDAQLQQLKNQLLAQNTSLAGTKTKYAIDTVKANNDTIAALDKQLDRFAVSGYDFDAIKNSVPDKFKSQIDAIKQLAGTQALGADQIRIAVQEVYKQAQESEKGQRIDGLPGEFANMKFGTMDRTKLKPNQLAEILRFADAPTADQVAQLQRESIKLQAERGVVAPVPTGRSSMLYGGTQATTQQPVTQPAAVRQTTTQPPAPSAVQPQAAPQTVTQAPTTQPSAGYSVVIAGKPVSFDRVNKEALINKPENILPLVDRQKLEQSKPATENLTRYTLRNIVDAKNSAQSLLNNDKYLELLSQRSAKLRSGDFLGIAIDQETAAANALLQNLLTRSFVTSLQEMRSASPTGGAVGSVAVQEMEALSRIQAAIQLGMPKKELKKQLEQYINVSERSMRTLPQEFGKTYTYQGEFNDILEGNVVPPAQTTDRLNPDARRAYEKYRPRGGN